MNFILKRLLIGKRNKNPSVESLRINGKSFFFASFFLNKNDCLNATKLYSFCRFSDDLADSKNIKNSKLLINIREQILNSKKVKRIEVIQILDLIMKTNISVSNILELLDGLISDTKIVRIKNESELINYSYKVAGTVGIMMCTILGVRDNKAQPFAIDLGIAMQLTNIARDILEDAHMNRVYIPNSWIDIEPKEIINKKFNQQLKLITKKILHLADKYYLSALNGLGYLPLKSRFAVYLALRIYRGIGVKIIKKNYCNLYKRVSTTFFQKVIYIITTLLLFTFKKRLHTKNKIHNENLHFYLKKNYDY